MNIATIIVSLLPIICGEYQEMQLIRELNDYFNFDHHFFLLDASAETRRYINTKGLTPQSLYVLRSADDVNGLKNVESITSKNTLMIVVPDSSQFDHNFILLRWMKTIQRLQINMKIGVFFSQHSSTEDLHMFFEWCKDNLIINIFAATHPSNEVVLTCANCSINIFTFNPFGTFGVLNVTSSETYDGFFLSLNSNFHQHELQLGSPLYYFETNIWHAVFRRMNASFAVVENNYTDASEAFENGIDIIPACFAAETLIDLAVYPSELSHCIILVPEALPYSGFSVYLRNAISGKLCGYSFISIVAVILVLSILRYTEQKKVLFFQSAADVLNVLMNDNGYIKYPKLSRSEVLLIVPLTFLGLVVTNGILSNLKSYLTSPVLQPEINTLEEIYRSPFRILVYSEHWKGAVIDELTNLTEGKDWSNRVFRDDEYYVRFIETYNRTKAYFVDTGDGNFLLKFQKRLKIKGYHNPQIQIFSKLCSYPVNDKFLFFERLNEIMLGLNSAGLYEQWIQRDHDYMEAVMVKKYLERLISHKETSEETYVDQFEFPMFVFYGWSAGLIVLVLEIAWEKNRKKIWYFCKIVNKLKR